MEKTSEVISPCIYFFSLFLLIILDFKKSIYPSQPKNQFSPKQNIEAKSENLFPAVKLAVYEHGARDKRRVALTFDTDMTPAMQKLLSIDDNKDKNEILSAQKAIYEITNITPKYFRFRGGCFDNNDLHVVNQLGLAVVHWDVIAGDGFNQNPDSIVEKVEAKIQNGSIVVFHLQRGLFAPKTNEALVKIILDLRKKGFEFVKVSQILGDG